MESHEQAILPSLGSAATILRDLATRTRRKGAGALANEYGFGLGGPSSSSQYRPPATQLPVSSSTSATTSHQNPLQRSFEIDRRHEAGLSARNRTHIECERGKNEKFIETHRNEVKGMHQREGEEAAERGSDEARNFRSKLFTFPLQDRSVNAPPSAGLSFEKRNSSDLEVPAAAAAAAQCKHSYNSFASHQYPHSQEALGEGTRGYENESQIGGNTASHAQPVSSSRSLSAVRPSSLDDSRGHQLFHRQANKTSSSSSSFEGRLPPSRSSLSASTSRASEQNERRSHTQIQQHNNSDPSAGMIGVVDRRVLFICLQRFVLEGTLIGRYFSAWRRFLQCKMVHMSQMARLEDISRAANVTMARRCFRKLLRVVTRKRAVAALSIIVAEASTAAAYHALLQWRYFLHLRTVEKRTREPLAVISRAAKMSLALRSYWTWLEYSERQRRRREAVAVIEAHTARLTLVRCYRHWLRTRHTRKRGLVLAKMGRQMQREAVRRCLKLWVLFAVRRRLAKQLEQFHFFLVVRRFFLSWHRHADRQIKARSLEQFSIAEVAGNAFVKWYGWLQRRIVAEKEEQRALVALLRRYFLMWRRHHMRSRLSYGAYVERKRRGDSSNSTFASASSSFSDVRALHDGLAAIVAGNVRNDLHMVQPAPSSLFFRNQHQHGLRSHHASASAAPTCTTFSTEVTPTSSPSASMPRATVGGLAVGDPMVTTIMNSTQIYQMRDEAAFRSSFASFAQRRDRSGFCENSDQRPNTTFLGSEKAKRSHSTDSVCSSNGFEVSYETA